MKEYTNVWQRTESDEMRDRRVGAHHDDDKVEPFMMPLDESFIVSSGIPLVCRPEYICSLGGLEGCSGGIFETKFVQRPATNAM